MALKDRFVTVPYVQAVSQGKRWLCFPAAMGHCCCFTSRRPSTKLPAPRNIYQHYIYQH